MESEYEPLDAMEDVREIVRLAGQSIQETLKELLDPLGLLGMTKDTTN